MSWALSWCPVPVPVSGDGWCPKSRIPCFDVAIARDGRYPTIRGSVQQRGSRAWRCYGRPSPAQLIVKYLVYTFARHAPSPGTNCGPAEEQRVMFRAANYGVVCPLLGRTSLIKRSSGWQIRNLTVLWLGGAEENGQESTECCSWLADVVFASSPFLMLAFPFVFGTVFLSPAAPAAQIRTGAPPGPNQR
jgi:hypothetical protein